MCGGRLPYTFFIYLLNGPKRNGTQWEILILPVPCEKIQEVLDILFCSLLTILEEQVPGL